MNFILTMGGLFAAIFLPPLVIATLRYWWGKFLFGVGGRRNHPDFNDIYVTSLLIWVALGILYFLFFVLDVQITFEGTGIFLGIIASLIAIYQFLK